MYHPATMNAIVVYHTDSEQVRMTVKDAHNLDDPAWLSVNEDPAGHAMMHFHPDEYNAMDHRALHEHLAKYIPIHKSWLAANPHHHSGNQRVAAAEFRKHLSR
jgi:hypothetical protein